MEFIMRISQSELEVLSIIWDRSGLAASDLYETLKPDTGWSLQTVKTLLARLTEKQAIRTERDGRRFLYYPLITRESYEAQATRGFVKRLFGGRAAPLIARLAENDDLTDADISEIEALIAKMKHDR